MTILTVRANDTATAMEEIVEKLGTESYILSTKKIGNEMLVKATNNPVKKQKNKKHSQNKFPSMISKELRINDRDLSGSEHNGKENNTRSINQLLSGNSLDINALEELNSEVKSLKSTLDDMILTDMAGLSPNLQSTTKVKLQKLGFSDSVLRRLKHQITNTAFEDGKNLFLKKLAEDLANDNPNEAIFDSRYIFVLGASGSGKTTLSAKFAARIAQESKNRVVALGQLGTHKDLHMDSLKSYSRLINVPNINMNEDNAIKKLIDVQQKVVVDVSLERNETLNTINTLRERVGASNVLTVMILPAGSNKHYIKSQVSNYGTLKPLVACTKTDENVISPEEFSSIAAYNLSIGYLTGTKSILNSISFVDKSFLAQYLKESIVTINQ